MRDRIPIIPSAGQLARGSAVIVLAGVALLGCTSGLQSGAPPSVQIVSLSTLDGGDAGRRLLVSLAIENMRSESLELAGVEFRARLGGEGFVEGRAAQSISVAPHAREILMIEVGSEFISSLSRLTAYLQGPESTLPYRISGRLVLATRQARFLDFSADGRTPLAVPFVD